MLVRRYQSAPRELLSNLTLLNGYDCKGEWMTMGSRPNSTTVTPNSDIDYILSYGIHIDTISTLQQSFPCHSDHLGTVFDIDLACSFSSSYTDICQNSPRMLTSGNLWSVNSYIKHVSEQIKGHKLEEKVDSLLERAIHSPTMFSTEDTIALNMIDSHLTDIMLAGEQQCSGRWSQRQFWSPQQREITRTFSYWKQKSILESKKLF